MSCYEAIFWKTNRYDSATEMYGRSHITSYTWSYFYEILYHDIWGIKVIRSKLLFIFILSNAKYWPSLKTFRTTLVHAVNIISELASLNESVNGDYVQNSMYVKENSFMKLSIKKKIKNEKSEKHKNICFLNVCCVMML